MNKDDFEDVDQRWLLKPNGEWEFSVVASEIAKMMRLSPLPVVWSGRMTFNPDADE